MKVGIKLGNVKKFGNVKKLGNVKKFGIGWRIPHGMAADNASNRVNPTKPRTNP